MMGGLLLSILLVLAGQASGSDQSFFESFDRGWESRWAYSNQKKYTGRFEHVVRPHSRGQDMAIMVRRLRLCASWAPPRAVLQNWEWAALPTRLGRRQLCRWYTPFA